MNKVGLGFSSLVLGLVVIFYFLTKNTDRVDGSGGELVVHCAAGLRKPMEQVARLYEAESGVKIALNYGGSGQLYGKLKLAGGDLYLPADSSYIDQAKVEGLVSESFTVSQLTAVIMVAKGNPKGIHSLEDLTQKGLRVALAEKSAAVGRFSHEVLGSAEVLEAVEGGRCSKYSTVNEVALQVQIGAADAGVIWDCLMAQYPDFGSVELAEFSSSKKRAMVGVLKKSKNRATALSFAKFIVAKDQGRKVFSEHGFEVLAE